MELWHEVCQATTLAEYNQIGDELEIADLSFIAENGDSPFQYADRKYLTNVNNQKHCYFWTNEIRHYNKRVTSTAEWGKANIKLALESSSGDLPEVVRVIREKIEHQLRKIHLLHSSDKNGNIRASLNIGIFCYRRYEMKEYTLDLIATHAKSVNVTTVLPECTGVFTKTLGLPYKHKIQESFIDPDHPLRQDDLHPHWCFNPLEDKQPVEPLARIQPPIQTRRRGWPKVHVENCLLLKSQLLGPRIRLQVKIRLEERVGIFRKGVEVRVMVEAKHMQGIFPVKINLVEPVYNIRQGLKKKNQLMNLISRLQWEVDNVWWLWMISGTF